MKLEKIGSRYGAWVIPAGILNSTSICYCAGCGEDISFDLGLIEKYSCQVYGFDPTPRSIRFVRETTGDNPNYHFSEFGLWDREERVKFYAPKMPGDVSHSIVNLQKTGHYFEAGVRPLAAIMADNRHRRLDLLKLDIEGAEYRVIDSILDADIGIGILCVEFDEINNPLDRHYTQRIRRAIDRLLQAGFRLIHAEINGNRTFIREEEMPKAVR